MTGLLGTPKAGALVPALAGLSGSGTSILPPPPATNSTFGGGGGQMGGEFNEHITGPNPAALYLPPSQPGGKPSDAPAVELFLPPSTTKTAHWDGDSFEA